MFGSHAGVCAGLGQLNLILNTSIELALQSSSKGVPQSILVLCPIQRFLPPWAMTTSERMRSFVVQGSCRAVGWTAAVCGRHFVARVMLPRKAAAHVASVPATLAAAL